mgnify:CR=1 FL=1
MVYILAHTKTKDYKEWRSVFNEMSENRRSNGEKSARVFQSVQDPNDVTILFEWDSAENAQKYMKSKELQDARERGGAIGDPVVHILNQV